MEAEEAEVEIDEETSTTESALTGSVTMNWFDCDGAADCTVYTGDLDTQTCFLSGLKGDMTLSSYWYSGAQVTPSTFYGKWKVYVSGPAVRALVTCINATGNRITGQTWRHGDPTLVIPGGPNPTRRQCFAGSITTSRPGFDYSPMYVQIRRNANNTHSVYGTSVPSDRMPSITATCVDAIDQGPLYYGNGGSSTVTGTVIHNPWGANTVACGLTGLGGIFNSSGDGWYLGYNYATDNYTFTSTPGTQGGVRCVK